MSGQLAPELLVPYMAAAAREVEVDGVLSDRSVWALEDAIAQLGSFGKDVPGEPRALTSFAEEKGSALSVLLLSDQPIVAEGDADDPNQHEAAAVARLTQIRGDVERLRVGDGAAAKRLRPQLDRIVELLVLAA